MLLLRRLRSVLTLMFALVLLFVCSVSLVHAQASQAPVTAVALSQNVIDESANLELELYLLAASNGAASEAGRVPKALEPVMKQLRASLPFENYRLAATMLSRVRNKSRLNVKGVGATPFSNVSAAAPLFSDYFVNSVTLKNDLAGQPIIELLGFRFGAQVPVQTSVALPGGVARSTPVVQYENTGIHTDFSLREGEPVIVGTLNVGQPGEAYILVVSVHRTR